MGFDVLVIEDDAATRDSIAATLQDAGLSVRAATDGQEGLRLLHEERPKVVLLDLMLPVMNGWKTVDSIRADPALTSLPVVTMTAFVNTPRPKGSAGFLRKPITRDALLRELKPYVGALLRN
jgi:CheY-like chemotaxis protein